MGAFIKDQVNQLLKVQELNLLKMQERNISSYWRRGGGRQVYLKAIFKNGLKQWLDIANGCVSLSVIGASILGEIPRTTGLNTTNLFI